MITRRKNRALFVFVLLGTIFAPIQLCYARETIIEVNEKLKAAMAKKDYRAGYAAASELIKQSPSARGYGYRGRCAIGLGKYDLALDDLNHAVSMQPENLTYRWHRSDANQAEGKFKDSLADLKILISKKPLERKYLQASASAHLALKEFDEGIKVYSVAIKAYPDVEIFVKERAKVYLQLKRYDKAISDFTRAIKLKPDISNTYYLRGISYFELKKYDQAVDDFSRQIELEGGKKAGAFVKRAQAYEKLGKLKEARQDRERANKVDDFEL